MTTNDPLILVTGATGYIGGRLYPRLLDAGYRVRCMAREPTHLRTTHPALEKVKADVSDETRLRAALQGVDTAYYLIHSMGESTSFETLDAEAATRFGRLAHEEGVRHIVYLGGLGDDDEALSAHLHSRQEVGHILRASGVPVTELRASIIIGSGSLSFEMIRSLVERLPFMITPRWVGTLAQPIAINDVLAYLLQSIRRVPKDNPIYEIGGADQISYRDLMHAYAKQRGLTRRMVPVPFMTLRLSSLWLGLVTPLYARIGRKLVDSLKYPTVCRDTKALTDFDIRPLGYREAIRLALKHEDRDHAETQWSDAVSAVGIPETWAGVRFGNRMVDSRSITVPISPEKAFVPIQRIGGTNGWYFADVLWSVRGWIDLLAGGPGMRRGRRSPDTLSVGDPLDCWRVEEISPPHCLRLRAEMRFPGRAWLEFTVEGNEQESVITQTASLDPLGLPGLLYWYGLYAFHQIIFAGMLRAIARRATRIQRP